MRFGMLQYAVVCCGMLRYAAVCGGMCFKVSPVNNAYFKAFTASMTKVAVEVAFFLRVLNILICLFIKILNVPAYLNVLVYFGIL